jgi:hypothetical protein
LLLEVWYTPFEVCWLLPYSSARNTWTELLHNKILPNNSHFKICSSLEDRVWKKWVSLRGQRRGVCNWAMAETLRSTEGYCCKEISLYGGGRHFVKGFLNGMTAFFEFGPFLNKAYIFLLYFGLSIKQCSFLIAVSLKYKKLF